MFIPLVMEGSRKAMKAVQNDLTMVLYKDVSIPWLEMPGQAGAKNIFKKVSSKEVKARQRMGLNRG